MLSSGATQTAETPTTANQVLDAPGSTPKNTPDSGASKPQTTDDKISPKLQVLIQREKSALERERSAKAKEAEVEAKISSFAEREKRVQEFENLKNTNPQKALEMLGMSYEDLTRVKMADGQLPPEMQVRRVEEKFDSFIKTQEAAARAQEEDAQKQETKKHAAVIDKFKGEIGTYIKDKSERYELIGFEQTEDLVYDVIDEHYNRTLEAALAKAKESGEDTADIRGEVMTIAEAADKVEAHLEAKYNKARNLKKVQTLLAPKPVKTTLEKPLIPQRQMPQTLNNNFSATQASARKSPLTDDQRVAKAIAYAKGLRP